MRLPYPPLLSPYRQAAMGCALSFQTSDHTSCSPFSEHANYFGVDEKLGPVAVSIKREKLEDHKDHGPQYQYRIIFRTREVGPDANMPAG